MKRANYGLMIREIDFAMPREVGFAVGDTPQHYEICLVIRSVRRVTISSIQHALTVIMSLKSRPEIHNIWTLAQLPNVVLPGNHIKDLVRKMS